MREDNILVAEVRRVREEAGSTAAAADTGGNGVQRLLNLDAAQLSAACRAKKQSREEIDVALSASASSDDDASLPAACQPAGLRLGHPAPSGYL